MHVLVFDSHYSQIVAGKKYVLTLVVGTSTDCKKDDASDSCPVSRNSVRHFTNYAVFPLHSYMYNIIAIYIVSYPRHSIHAL